MSRSFDGIKTNELEWVSSHYPNLGHKGTILILELAKDYLQLRRSSETVENMAELVNFMDYYFPQAIPERLVSHLCTLLYKGKPEEVARKNLAALFNKVRVIIYSNRYAVETNISDVNEFFHQIRLPIEGPVEDMYTYLLSHNLDLEEKIATMLMLSNTGKTWENVKDLFLTVFKSQLAFFERSVSSKDYSKIYLCLSRFVYPEDRNFIKEFQRELINIFGCPNALANDIAWSFFNMSRNLFERLLFINGVTSLSSVPVLDADWKLRVPLRNYKQSADLDSSNQDNSVRKLESYVSVSHLINIFEIFMQAPTSALDYYNMRPYNES